MTKTRQVYRDDDVVVSFDSTAFVQAITKVAADIASGPITPAEGRRRAANANSVLKGVELALKLRRTL